MTDARAGARWEAVIIGGGMAGLSAAIYLGRSRRRTLIIDSGHSMAKWEPSVENYLGFPEGISGQALLERGRVQALRFGAQWCDDHVEDISRGENGCFVVQGRQARYHTPRILLATGLTHVLP